MTVLSKLWREEPRRVASSSTVTRPGRIHDCGVCHVHGRNRCQASYVKAVEVQAEKSPNSHSTPVIPKSRPSLDNDLCCGRHAYVEQLVRIVDLIRHRDRSGTEACLVCQPIFTPLRYTRLISGDESTPPFHQVSSPATGPIGGALCLVFGQYAGPSIHLLIFCKLSSFSSLCASASMVFPNQLLRHGTA